MTSAYDVSPACRERQCRLTMREAIISDCIVYQHGDNPEAVLIVSYSRLARSIADFVRDFRVWTERAHRYEDGELT